MNFYGYLVCHECHDRMWLGQAIWRGRHPDQEKDIAYYWRGPIQQHNFNQWELTMAIWKFMADHTNHKIAVLTESQMSDEMFGYREIGGDDELGVTFEKYLKNWPPEVKDTSEPEDLTKSKE